MIKTQTVSINPNAFFKHLLLERVRTRWYAFLFSPLAAVVLHFTKWDETGDIVHFLLVFSVLYPVWVVGYYYYYARSSQNVQALQLRHYELDGDLLRIFMEGENIGEIQVSKCPKAIERREAIALYQQNGQFIFIPKKAFGSNEDLERFCKVLQHKCGKYKKV